MLLGGSVLREGTRGLETVIIVGVLAVAAVVVLGPVVQKSSAYTPHAPIYIDGNGEFTAANGVTGGSGTPSDPFIIDGWDIDASAAKGIQIWNTDAPFLVRNVYVHSGAPSFVGIEFYNVTDGRVENATVLNNWIGISLGFSANATVSGNNVSSNAGYGIHLLLSSTNVTIAGNNVSSNNWAGIFLDSSTNITISGNNVSSNGGDGIYLSSATNATITGNSVSSSSWTGILLSSSTNATISANSISENDFGISLLFSSANATITRNDISYNDATGIHLFSSDNATITGNNASSNNGDGIGLDASRNATITRNTLSNNGGGIRLATSPDAILSGNNVSSTNWDGILLLSSENATITENKLSNNLGGIGLEASTNATITANNLSNNGFGISLLSSSANAIITGNNVSWTNWDGILISSSDNATITLNTLSNNVGGIGLVSSGSIRVHHNHLLNNGWQAYDDGGSENAWDDGYPSGGNYWSDYAGADVCSGPNQDVCQDPDGIGDTPYLIDFNTRDNYPLVPPNTVPVAAFSVEPDIGNVTTSFAVDASSSWDAEDSPPDLEVRWDWEDDGTWDTTWSTTKTAEHQYAAPATYTIRLEVRDTNGLTNTTSREVIVRAFGGDSQSPILDPLFAIGILLGAVILTAVLLLLLRKRRSGESAMPEEENHSR